MAGDDAESIRRLNPPELGTPPGYSQIVDVRASRIIFIAGQTALDRQGALVGKNDFPAQAEQVFRNLSTALLSVGCTASNLAKLTVFLRDMVIFRPIGKHGIVSLRPSHHRPRQPSPWSRCRGYMVRIS
jgi:enamine deaminase RidA (YjgF/YER057c/UK114 family)